MLKLYGFKKVNAMARGYTRDLRVLWALEEMQMPFQLVGMDHPANDLKTESYRKLNPLGQIPVIDDDGVVLSESGAILIYLARKSKKLIPGDFIGESQVIRWCFVATNSLEIPLMTGMMVDWVKGKEPDGYRDFLNGWAQLHLSGLETYFETHTYLANEMFSVADILMVHVLAAVKDERLLEPFPRVRAYRDRQLNRPAWKATLERYFKNVEPG